MEFLQPRGAMIWLVVLCVLLCSTFPAWAEPTVKPDAWIADLDYLAQELPARHANLFANVPEADWRAAVAQVRGYIPQLSDGEIVMRLLWLIAMAGDSHTALDIEPLNFKRYPVEVSWFEDGLVVLAAEQTFAGCLRSKLVAIDGQPIAQVIEQVGRLFSHENESQLKKTLPYYLVNGELLAALGVTSDPERAQLTFMDQYNQQYTWDIWTIANTPEVQWSMALGDSDPCPLYRQQPDNPYYCKWLPDLGLVYLQYNSCQESEDLPMADFTAQVLDTLRTQPYTRFVIDQRFNGGGNSGLLDPLIEAIAADPNINQRGKLFVIIGRRTFSSALLNAMSLKQKTQAILVGEPTGGKPNHFGEVQTFELPNSMLTVSYSTKYFQTVEGDPAALEPDILVELTSVEFFAGADPALDAVLAYQ